MGEVLIIGLPQKVRQRVENSATRNGVRITSILAGLRSDRTFQLLPHPSQAVHTVRNHIDKINDFSDVSIVVLPYAPIPDDLKTELDAIDELGGNLRRPVPGTDDWPAFRRRKKGDSDHIFDRKLCDRIAALVCSQQVTELPSAYFERLQTDHPRFLVADGVMELCDSVAPHRYEFMRVCADAFVEILQEYGSVGVMQQFFSTRGLTLAQSGGISTTIRVIRAGKVLHNETSNMHLKQGDSTTPQSAARIYFQHFSIDSEYYIAISYAGPHPNTNTSCELTFD